MGYDIRYDFDFEFREEMRWLITRIALYRIASHRFAAVRTGRRRKEQLDGLRVEERRGEATRRTEILEVRVL